MKSALLTLIIISFYFTTYSQSYYVAGSFQGWDPVSTIMYDDGTNGDLTANDGIHSRELVLATAANYEWKVTIGNWTQSWPQSNSWFETTADNQTVLFTFNTNLMGDSWLPNQYIVNTNEPSPNILVLVGSFQSELGEPGGDWVNNSNVTVMHDDGLDGDLAANDGIYAYHGVLPAGTWEGKIVKLNSWNGWGIDGRSINGLNLSFATTENQHLYFYADLNTGRILLNFDIPVPVELVSFSANVSINSVTLNWITATELNNSGFEIQKLKDSEIEKFLDWEIIGFVNGNGTTSESHSYSFVDKNLTSGKYLYRLKQIDFDGTFTYSNEVEVDLSLPQTFSLEQNYPNPFNPNTTIKYSIPNVISTEVRNLNVTIKVYDVLGNEIATLVDEYKPAGNYEVSFNAKTLSSGTYFYRLQAASFVETKKMVLLR